MTGLLPGCRTKYFLSCEITLTIRIKIDILMEKSVQALLTFFLIYVISTPVAAEGMQTGNLQPEIMQTADLQTVDLQSERMHSGDLQTGTTQSGTIPAADKQTASEPRHELADFAPFITTWKSDNPGESEDTQITIPTHPDETYNYTVFWVNVDDENHNGTIADIDGSVTIEFGTPGTYRVKIAGIFPRIFFNQQGFFGAEGDWEKILLVNQWGDISWSSMEHAFSGTVNLDVVAEDAPDLSNVESMRAMFLGAVSLNGEIGHWQTGNVTDMQWVFRNATAFNQPIGDWDTGNVTNMFGMFSSARTFNQPIGDWNTGKVTNMAVMFSGADAFNQPIGDWDTSEVTAMWSIFSAHFSGQSSFNQSIGNWDTGKVTDMSAMFSSAFVFDQPIGDWDTGNVTDMGFMFQNARAFNQPIGSWNTEKVTNMNGMFQGAESFNQPLNDWQTGEVTDMGSMFNGASSFNQPLNNWDTGKVTTMRGMFRGQSGDPYSFNRNLGSWDIRSVTDMEFMLDESALSIANYDRTLSGWAGAENTPSGIRLGAFMISYCNTEARSSLIDTYNWTIIGDAPAENCPDEILPCPADGNNLFVKKGASGDGSSWNNALGELRDALALYENHSCTADDANEIWVSAGTYLPTDDPENREAAFKLINDVAIYGGFTGVETSLHDRNHLSNISILSGDIDGNDADFDPAADSDDNPDTPPQTDHLRGANSYSVVISLNNDHTAVLDGFTITAGMADGPGTTSASSMANGGGIFNDGASATFSNLVISGNYARSRGGGMINRTSGGSPRLANVIISGNSANSGAGMYNDDMSSPFLTNVLISDNTANNGAGIFNYFGSSITMTNVTIAGNTGENSGIFNDGSNTLNLTNTIVWDVMNSSRTPNISYSLILGNDDTSNGNINADGLSVEDIFSDPANGDFSLGATSPAINAGNPDMDMTVFTVRNNGIVTDLSGNRRVRGGRIDIGAYEFQDVETFLVDDAGSVPVKMELYQNYPNPFNPVTMISFDVPVSGQVRMAVYDLLGRQVAVLINRHMETGRHQVTFDAGLLSTGMYLYRLESDSGSITRKMTLVK